MDTTVSRRSFVAGAAAVAGVAAAAGQLGAGSTARAAEAPAQEAWDAKPASVADKVSSTEDHEVVIVGGGNAGVICGVEAAELGADVIVLEKTDANTMWAGDIDACDSQLQKDAGVEADKEYVIHDLVRYASGKCDENLIRLWAYNAGAFVDWYQAKMQEKGLDVMVDTVKKQFYPDNFYFTNTYHTAYKPPLEETKNPMGSEVAVPALLEIYAENGGTMQYNTKVVELVQGKDGAVTGVIAQVEDGSMCSTTPAAAWCWPRAAS